jgi:hypothetical protein
LNQEKNKTLLELMLYFSVIAVLLMISPATVSYLVKSVAVGIIIDLILFKTKFIKNHSNDQINIIYMIISFLFSILLGMYLCAT